MKTLTSGNGRWLYLVECVGGGTLVVRALTAGQAIRSAEGAGYTVMHSELRRFSTVGEAKAAIG